MQEYINADQHLHHLCQIIAKASRTYIPKKEDDSHTNLYYDSLADRIIGRWIVRQTFGQIVLTFNLANFHFEWLNSTYQVLESVNPVDKTFAVVESDLAKTIEKLGLDPAGYSAKLHFEIPAYSFAADKISKIDQKDLNHWRFYRKLANDSCGWLLGHLQKESEIRIWPHHFDTGFYVPVNEKLGIGFGLAMKDNMAGDSYFYISGYGLQGEINYQNMPKLENGRWEIAEHWKGGLLKLSEIKESNESLVKFIQQTTKWFLNI